MEDDRLSITSTVVTVYSENHEFQVDSILAEDCDKKEYLLSWLGYPEFRNTWEPKINISPELRASWNERKAREARGLEKPYDVNAWEKEVERHIAAKENRHKARKAMRRELNQPVSDSEFDEAVEADSDIEDGPSMLRRKTAFKKTQLFGQNKGESLLQAKGSSSDELPLIMGKQPAQKNVENLHSNSTGYAGNAYPESARQPQSKTSKRSRSRSESSPDIPLVTKRRQEATPATLSSSSYKISKWSAANPRPEPSGEQIMERGSASSGRGGKTATRGNYAKGSRNILSTSANPNARPKKFSNMRIGRIAQQRARGLADREPDIGALGEAFKPARPSEFQSMTGFDIRKARDGEDDETGLFVDIEAPARKHVPEAFIAPPYLPSSKGPPPDPSRATCYYFDRVSKDPSQPPCMNGQQCQFLHAHEPGVPVAPPPPNSRAMSGGSRLICFFWDWNYQNKGAGECANSSCAYIHEYLEGVPVAPRPPNWREPESRLASPAKSLPNVGTEPPRVRPIYSESWGTQAVCFKWLERECPDEGFCRYIHSDAKDLPIGPAPSKALLLSENITSQHKNHVPKETQPDTSSQGTWPNHNYFATCFYWDRDGSCTKGAECGFLHSYRDDAPIAPNPSSPEATRFRSTSRNSTRDNRKLDIVCRHWANGKCWDGPNCLYRHSRQNHDSEDIEMSDTLPSLPEPVPCEDDQSIPPLSEAEEARRNQHEPQMTKATKIIHFRSEEKWYATCYEWDIDFECVRGSRCKYLHAYRSDAPLAPAPLARVRPGEVCPYWKKKECYRTEADCAFRHTNIIPESSSTRDSHANKPLSARDASEMHPSRAQMLEEPSPIDRPFEFQASPLRFAKSLPGSQPLPAVSHMSIEEYINQDTSWKVPQTCKFWESGGCRKRDVDCEYFHDKLVHPQQNHPCTIIDGRKKVFCPCRFWIGGHCQRTAEDCEHLHYIPLFEDDTATKKPSPQPGADLSSSLSTRPVARRTVTFDIFDDEPMHVFDEQDVIQKSAYSQNRKSLSLHTEAEINHPHEPPTIDHVRGTQSLGDTSLDRQTGLHLAQSQTSHSKIVQSLGELAEIQSNMVDPMSAPKAKKKVSLGDYKRGTTNNMLAAHAKEIVFAGSHSVIADFRDLAQLQQSWVAEISPLAKLKFSHMCMVDDLKDVFDANKMRVMWRSSLILSNPSEAASLVIDLVVREMKERTSALACVFQDFFMLVYPNSSEWKFLGSLDDDNDQNAKLKFAILEGRIQPQKRLNPISSSETIVPAVPHRKALVKLIHDLELKKLIPVNQPANVFLIFPPLQETKEFLISWLHASCLPSMNLKVYSSQEEGSWDFFVKNIRSGSSNIVLIHESLTADIWRIPKFLDAVMKSAIFWCILDSGSPYPAYPSHYTGVEERPPLGHITAISLLPHGQAFLLTPSFIVAEPTKVLELLNWFLTPGGGKLEASTPGTWKLVACHGLANYIHDVAASKVHEKEEFQRTHHDKPALDQMLADKGLDFATCTKRYAIHQKLVEFERLGVIKFSLEEEPSEEEYSPIIYAPPMIDPNNEQALVEWFASWALQKLDKHRKFTVIGTGLETKEFAFRGLDKAEDMAINDQIDQMISDERRRASGQGQSLQINTSSGRPSQSPFQAPISPAFSPRFAFPGPLQSAKSPFSPASRSAHSPGSPMDIDSDPIMGTSDIVDWKEKGKKSIVFEPTITWYARLRTNGGAYEHLLVDRSSVAFKNIGVRK